MAKCLKRPIHRVSLADQFSELFCLLPSALIDFVAMKSGLTIGTKPAKPQVVANFDTHRISQCCVCTSQTALQQSSTPCTHVHSQHMYVMNASTASQHRFTFIALGWLTLYAIAITLGPALWDGLMEMGLSLNAHGHAHVHAHGHPFVDARTMLGVPNFWDVLTNLPFAAAAGLGWWWMRGVNLPTSTRQSLHVLMAGLLATALGSGYYHWWPDAWVLMWDRLGMAVAFAGMVGLTVCDRVGAAQGGVALKVTLPLAIMAAVVALVHGHPLAWVVVQFGGCVLISWAAFQPQAPQALNINWGWVLAGYALAKVLEANDELIFHATHELISGHSLKHLAACLAVFPVLSKLRQNG
jgi:hypothetical protein